MHRLAFRFFLAAFLASVSCGYSGENAAPADSASLTNAADSQQVLRAYLQLQEQIHATGLLIEQARKDAEGAARRNSEAIQAARAEAEAASRRNAETIAARLKLIEETLTLQREREFEVIQKSNRLLVTIVGIVGGSGLLAILLTAFCLWRGLGQVAQITTALQPLHSFGRHNALADAPFVTLNTPESSNTRLLGAIEKLERRIRELETTAALPRAEGSHASENGDGEAASGSRADRVSVLLSKGQAALNANEPQRAIEAFDAALEIEPDNAEALVKKGTALEQTKRLEEAIECYDRAIAANQTMTVAYLHKGAIYNQMERFSEALECYEQALRTQQKPVST